MDVSRNYVQWPGQKDEYIIVERFTGKEPVDIHMHDFIEIAFISSGTCKHIYQKREITLIPGDVFIVVPHLEHSYCIHSETVIYNCLFYPEALGEDWQQITKIGGIFDILMVEPFYREETGQQSILHLGPEDASYIERLLKNIIDEDNKKDIGYQVVKKANLILILVSLGKIWKSQQIGINNSYSGKRDMLIQAINYIENNYYNNMSIKDVASRVYLSPQYFGKVFREYTGLTPIEYINRLRISQAEKLLLDKSYTISKVAETVGIDDVNYFSRLFKSITGCSPSEYRKR